MNGPYEDEQKMEIVRFEDEFGSEEYDEKERSLTASNEYRILQAIAVAFEDQQLYGNDPTLHV